MKLGTLSWDGEEGQVSWKDFDDLHWLTRADALVDWMRLLQDKYEAMLSKPEETEEEPAMTLTIDVYKDYTMIGDQKLTRPKATAAGQWMEEWQKVKELYELRGQQP